MPIADRLFTNASIRTMAPASPTDGAPLPTALASWRGRILAVGDPADVDALVGPGTEVVDLGGATVLPGFIETHMHPIAAGAQMSAPRIGYPDCRSVDDVVATLAARASGRGVHLDCSQYEAMMHAFQVFRPMYEAMAPDYAFERQIMIPSIEPAADGMVALCCITGQQWQDLCAMIDAPDLADDEELWTLKGRQDRREEVWPRLHAFTTAHTVDEVVDLATAFRIPCGPVGDGATLPTYDHFVERGVFVSYPQGFTAPRPPATFSAIEPAPRRPAPALGASGDEPEPVPGPALGADPARPLAGIRILDLGAFWAGPIATNLLRVLGADLVKVESHVRLDGMRWAAGYQRERLWEWSPGYHGANAGKTLAALDLTTEAGRDVVWHLLDDADVVLENFSPRVMDSWGLTWAAIHDRNPRAVYLRAPAFGLDGPWRGGTGSGLP